MVPIWFTGTIYQRRSVCPNGWGLLGRGTTMTFRFLVLQWRREEGKEVETMWLVEVVLGWGRIVVRVLQREEMFPLWMD